MRNWYDFPAPDLQKLTKVLTLLAAKEEYACVLGGSENKGFTTHCIAGLGALEVFTTTVTDPDFKNLQLFVDKHPDWLFGHFSYDLKNQIEPLLFSMHTDQIGFSLLHFFRPRVIVRFKKPAILAIGVIGDFSEAKSMYEQILQHDEPPIAAYPPIELQCRTSKTDYIKTIQALKSHIARGDIYEINYCIEFFAEQVQLDPAVLQLRLNTISGAPFAAFYKLRDQYLCCASPERFLSKTGTRLQSQPMKGTRPRGQTFEEDKRLRDELANDAKERCENVMIVDLVRNDLSRSARKGSVTVSELYGIHAFQTVHQMISTVEAELADDVHPVAAIARAFPMGSMTGAPKLRMLQLAEEYEQIRRGLYAGAVGYFTPEQDFDFNVVIRSIQYNAKTQYLSMMVGSAITAAAIPEQEYAECLVKADSLFKALKEL